MVTLSLINVTQWWWSMLLCRHNCSRKIAINMDLRLCQVHIQQQLVGDWVKLSSIKLLSLSDRGHNMQY